MLGSRALGILASTRGIPARLCPPLGLILLTSSQLSLSQSCASSADRNTEAARELAALQAEHANRDPRECRPGTQGSCFEGPPASAGRGMCKDGQRVCNPQGRWGPCKGQVLPSANDLCDGLDNDCNGVIDDGFPRVGSPCTRGQGECEGRGVYQCRADGTAADCSARRLAPGIEICDGLDNDCDGQIDEASDLDRNERCRTGKPGACAEGRKRCRQGKVQCVPLHAPTHEVCNGRDDDCNGRVDDDCTPA